MSNYIKGSEYLENYDYGTGGMLAWFYVLFNMGDTRFGVASEVTVNSKVCKDFKSAGTEYLKEQVSRSLNEFRFIRALKYYRQYKKFIKEVN